MLHIFTSRASTGLLIDTIVFLICTISNVTQGKFRYPKVVCLYVCLIVCLFVVLCVK